MTLALSLFVLFYILMLAVQQYRPWVALGGAGAFLLLGKLGVYDFTLADAARAVDFNVLLMMAGMMGTVFLFIQSKMPARLAEELIAHMPDVRWAVSVLALLADINQRLNLTIVLITHQLEVVKTICDHAALLEQGEIVESGKLADLLVTPWSRLRQSLLHDPQAEQEFLTRHGVQGRPLCGVA